MHDYLQKESCRYSKNFKVNIGVQFMIFMMQSVDFAFFREGENRSFSRVPGDVINDPNTLTPYIFWKPRMSSIRKSCVFFNILTLIFPPISTAWITVQPLVCTLVYAVLKYFPQFYTHPPLVLVLKYNK